MTLKTILAAVDMFPQDDAVLTRALEFATAHNAALTVVHVIDIPGHTGDLSRADTLHGQAAIAARDRINDALARLEVDPSTIEISIESGSPALRLIEICIEAMPDLVVMRAHLKENIAENILGSTSDRVIAAGVASVLIVKRVIERPYVRVILATNGSDAARSALSFLTGLLPRAALHIIQTVQITPQFAEAMLRIGSGQHALAAHRDTLAQNAKKHLAELGAKATRPVTTRVLYGDPATELTRSTWHPKVDLIAIGPGRDGLIRRAFIGSVTRRLLRDAECDVLIFHP